MFETMPISPAHVPDYGDRFTSLTIVQFGRFLSPTCTWESDRGL
jgi:hypothetical protein